MLIAPIIHILAIFVGHTISDTKLDLYYGDDKIGTGTYKESAGHKGQHTREIKLWATAKDGTKVRIINTKVFDDKAFPILDEEQLDEDAGGIKTTTVRKVRYADSGAALFTEFKDKTHYATRTIAPIPGYSRADASDLWFSQTHPQPGTTVSSTVFDIEWAKWRVVETTYLGRKWITVGGRQVEANEVRDIRDGNVRKLYLDDKGEPLLMNNGSQRTERHF